MVGKFAPQRVARFTIKTSLDNYVRSRPFEWPYQHNTLARRRTHTRHSQNGIWRGPNTPRTLFTSSLPPLLIPPIIFVGLLLTLWTWKCFWIIVMQNKLLYLSWLPPFSRSEQISEYKRECRPVQWAEKRLRIRNKWMQRNKKARDYLLFSGKWGSLPLRLPLLSQFLNSVSKSQTGQALNDTKYIVVALSYRGYWTSSGTATQSGIEKDALAFLNWVSATYSSPDTNCQVFLWGHSLGAAVASSAMSKYLTRRDAPPPTRGVTLLPISGLIMEAPISNIKDMLIALYPQKWLPYRYLWPFSWNTWCSSKSLEQLARYRDRDADQRIKTDAPCNGRVRSVPPILLLAAENDEVIPPHVAGQLEQIGQDLGLEITRKDVMGAMHTECTMKNDGREALVKFILEHANGDPVNG
ncbi:hypothetical protein N7494_010276 [Penicillium frequentans]|uniref:AB hydrolase-1 domain-containing protein n=1 Tax=Penicillium frequentans TaxID=3151616 RepID=A0AAD6CRJ0_9EURO|nr:hypothetical protein N7494_010276 [Penicillium glabrum]